MATNISHSVFFALLLLLHFSGSSNAMKSTSISAGENGVNFTLSFGGGKYKHNLVSSTTFWSVIQ